MNESRCDRSEWARLGYIGFAEYFTRSDDSVGRPATTLRHSPLYVLFRTLDGTAPAGTQAHRHTETQTDRLKQAIRCGVRGRGHLVRLTCSAHSSGR